MWLHHLWDLRLGCTKSFCGPYSLLSLVCYPLRSVTHKPVRSRGNDWQIMAAKRAEGAARAAANAVGFPGDSDLLADTVRYGSAVFLTVLAFEESVKARILRAIAPAAAQGCSPGLSGASNRRRRQ